jgi:death-on-curing protein
MTEPRFLDLERVVKLHRILIDEYGGSHGVRDLGLLTSALAQPSSMFAGVYFHTDLFEMASAYLFHIVQNHPFIDGNKRVGAAAAILFLDLNGVEFEPDEDGLVDVTLAVASGRAGKPEITTFLRSFAAD